MSSVQYLLERSMRAIRHGGTRVLVCSIIAASCATTLALEDPVRTTFSLPKSVVLHEPVFLDFTLSNRTEHPVEVDLGHNRRSNFVFQIVGPDGKKTAELRKEAQGFGRIGSQTVPPYGSLRERLLLNDWYTFDVPGLYGIYASCQCGVGNAVVATPQFLELKVEPRDAERLRELAERFAGEALQTADLARAVAAAQALGQVTDVVAIPSLRKVLEQGRFVAEYAVAGLARIGSPEAVTVLVDALPAAEPELQSQIRGALQRLLQSIADPVLRAKVKAVLAG